MWCVVLWVLCGVHGVVWSVVGSVVGAVLYVLRVCSGRVPFSYRPPPPLSFSSSFPPH